MVVVLVALRFAPAIENPLAAKPKAAFVVLLAEGETVATDGAHALAAGRPFRLFAVLEAVDWRGETIWFSEAPAVRLGERDLPHERLRRWPDGARTKVRWLTVEGFAPYLELRTPIDLERFALLENFHPEWGDGWSVDGRVDPRTAQIEPGSPLRPLPFGRQRFAVRIEQYESDQALTPSVRVASLGADAFRAAQPAATAVVAALPPPLARVSTAFGKIQIEGEALGDVAIAAEVAELERRGLAFSRAALVAAHLAAAGIRAAELHWRPVDVARDALAWGDQIEAGDLLQAGPRVVVLFRDAGDPGRLDPDDLVFDLWRGVKIRRLGEVFGGEGGLALDLARLESQPP